jgi:hypothetical protein
MRSGKNFSPARKDRIKVIRSIIEGVILLFVLYLLSRMFFSVREYSPAKDQDMTQTENGFIAVSYFGVDRTGDEKLISTDRLDENLKALKDSGYVTITQNDIINYYKNGGKLPQKSLFLAFEDGRRDTAIFTQKVMEQYNYKATMLTYAGNLILNDPKFLSSKDLKSYEKDSFWEVGTNGYRLSYINVFDRYDNFLNQLDTYKFSELSSCLGRKYDHYLMDYIRDQHGVPMEELSQMQKRIAYDYTESGKLYKNAIGRVPGMYILMHSNTGKFGTNEAASIENEKWISEMYRMNFNREGSSSNSKASSIYDLTRIQPQSYWYTNHLLMRISEDTKQKLNFVSGDLQRKAYWNTLIGEAQFIKDTIVLTSKPKDRGLLELKNSKNYKDIDLSVEMKGNKKGSQSIYLRADKNFESYVLCRIKYNKLYLYEKEEGKPEKELYTLDLHTLDGKPYLSIEEDRLGVETKELETAIKHADKTDVAEKSAKLLEKKRSTQAKTVLQGAKAYIPEIAMSEPGDRLVDITLKAGLLTVAVDKKTAVSDIKVTGYEAGSVFVESAFSGSGYSQRNLTDNVYDGVFKNLVIKDLSGNKGEEAILYDNRLSDMDKITDKVQNIWNVVINWFIKNL